MTQGYNQDTRYIRERAERAATAPDHGPKMFPHPQSLAKWLNGRPHLHYSRAGYEWLNGAYIQTSLKATGITARFYGMSRHERRRMESPRAQRAARNAAIRAAKYPRYPGQRE